jgi:hypothetical protein
MTLLLIVVSIMQLVFGIMLGVWLGRIQGAIAARPESFRSGWQEAEMFWADEIRAGRVARRKEIATHAVDGEQQRGEA